jgi:hypothetical protein
LTGRYPEAAFIRELFDEPAALLYQVDALLDALDEIGQPGSAIDVETILAQIDQLIQDVVAVTEGPVESEIVKALFQLRNNVASQRTGADWETYIRSSQQFVMNLVNDFFHAKLIAMPEIAAYLEKLEAE